MPKNLKDLFKMLGFGKVEGFSTDVLPVIITTLGLKDAKGHINAVTIDEKTGRFEINVFVKVPGEEQYVTFSGDLMIKISDGG